VEFKVLVQLFVRDPQSSVAHPWNSLGIHGLAVCCSRIGKIPHHEIITIYISPGKMGERGIEEYENTERDSGVSFDSRKRRRRTVNEIYVRSSDIDRSRG
jgi:hypothetical protein